MTVLVIVKVVKPVLRAVGGSMVGFVCAYVARMVKDLVDAYCLLRGYRYSNRSACGDVLGGVIEWP